MTETIDLGLQQRCSGDQNSPAGFGVPLKSTTVSSRTARTDGFASVSAARRRLMTSFFTLTLDYSGWVSLAAQRQVASSGENAVVLRQWLRDLAQESGECITPLFQDEGIALGRNRPTVVKVMYSKGPSSILQADLLGLQGFTVASQDREQQAFMHLHTCESYQAMSKKPA